MKNKIKRFLLKLLNTMLIYKQELEFVDLKKRFKDVGENFKLRKDYSIYNPQYMEIGSNFRALERFRIEAFDAYGDQKFYPKINISKFGLEYLENGIWKSTNFLNYMAPPLKQFSIQTIAANSSQSLKYRVKYTINEVDILYSNLVEVKIKPCSLN